MRIQWTPERDALLGQFSDLVVAQRLGVGQTSVRNRRVFLGLAAKVPHRRSLCRDIDQHNSERLGDTSRLPLSTVEYAVLDRLMGPRIDGHGRIVDGMRSCDITEQGHRAVKSLVGEAAARAWLKARMAEEAARAPQKRRGVAIEGLK